MATMKLDGLESDSRAHVGVLTSQVEHTIAEKQAAEDAMREQRQRLQDVDRAQAQQAADLAQARRLAAGLADTVRFHSARLAQQEEALTRRVDAWAEVCDTKLRAADKKLYAAARAMSELRAERHVAAGVSESFLGHGAAYGARPAAGGYEEHGEEGGAGQSATDMLEERLSHTQAALQIALRGSEDDAAEKEELWAQLQRSQREQERLERLVQELRRSMAAHDGADRDRDTAYAINASRGASGAGHGHSHGHGAGGAATSAEEWHLLSERLSAAEQRAMTISAQSAKTFAQSARTIAFLEGEGARLKALVDHFRVVNEKLVGDLRLAREEGMNQRSLEHRLKLSCEGERVLQVRAPARAAIIADVCAH